MPLFSWWRASKEEKDDFEAILAAIDVQVKQTEQQIVAIDTRERQVLYAWFYYSVPTYLLFLLTYLLVLRSPHDAWDRWLAKAAPLIGVPLLIEGGRRLIRRYFAVRRGKLHAVLKRHRASQREKIEELKRKTAYYKTKGLIERYDATASPSRPLVPRPGMAPGSSGPPAQTAFGHGLAAGGAGAPSMAPSSAPPSGARPSSGPSASARPLPPLQMNSTGQGHHGPPPRWSATSPDGPGDPADGGSGRGIGSGEPSRRATMGGSAVRPSVSLADLKAGPASSDAGSAPWRRDALARRGDERSAMSPASSSSSTAALLPPRPDIIDPGAPVTVRPKSWMDRVMDTVIGDTDGPNNRYALICSQCHTHNGLALPQDFLTLSFRCHHCGMLNANRHAHASVAGRTAGTLATSRSYDVLRSPVGYSPSFPLLPQGTPGHPTFQKPSASFGGRGQREVWHDDAGDAGSGGDDDGSGEGDGHSSRGNGDDNDDGNDVGDPSRERSRAAAEASDASDTSDTEEPRAAAAARAASTPGRMLRRRHNLGVRTEPRLRQRSNEDDAGPDSHCNHGAPPSRSQRPGAAAVNRSEARPEADPAEGHAEVHANDHHASATTASKRVTRRTSSRLAAARSAPPASASSARLAAPADHD